MQGREQRRSVDGGQLLRKLYRYSLVGAATVVVVAAALALSAGSAASAGDGVVAGSGVADALQDPPADPGAVGGSGWSTSAAVDADEDCCDDGHMWGWGAGWWWLVMPIGVIVFWGGVIALIIWAIRQFSEGRGGGDNAIEIARHRYARGEISREEFDQIRRDLA
jgi:putative membrane protein